jgi:simple sugar transport system ATP-binding protein
VEGLSVKNALGSLGLKDFSFEVRQGEIVGIAGVDGNGQTELVEAITGLRPACSGRIWLDGREITALPVSERIRAGISHVPEDRQRRGLVMDFSLEDNLILGSSTEEPFAHRGLLQQAAVRAHAGRIIQRFDIRSSEGAISKAASLSGGNQQKAIVGREIEKSHKLLIAVQPTRGMDVGSIEYIRTRLLEERKNGKAVLLVSLELDEVLQLSDRIIAVNNGRLIGELPQAEATESNVGLMMAGVTLREGQDA